MEDKTANSPRISVIGLYSPSASFVEYEKFVAAYVGGCDPANFSSETLAFLKRMGREHMLTPATADERAEAEGSIRRALLDAVFVEALVENADDRFEAADFQQPSQLPPGLWQVAWNETYLSADGESVFSGYPDHTVPESSRFRVVFVIHDWEQKSPLLSSYGNLKCPPIEPLPERLWRLAPYEPVD